VTTKLAGAHHGSVEKACSQSISDLDIGYIDLYLVREILPSK